MPGSRRSKKADNYILAYYQAIRNGSETVGKWISLVYERIVAGIEAGDFLFDQAKANAAIEWIEAHAFHTEGPLAPGPMRLALWQKALVSCVFGLVDQSGTRQFREIVLIIGRKQGKSALAAAIAKYTWMLDGGYGAKVYTLAPKLEQADIIYKNVWQMTVLDPDYQAIKAKLEERDEHNKRIYDDAELPRHRQTDLYLPASNGTVKKIAFAAKTSDGFNPDLCICDEVAAWEGDKGLKQYEVMKSGMGAKPGALMLSCSTAGYVTGGIFDELLLRSTRVLLGNSKEKRLLPFLYMIDDVGKWNDINELRKANPNMGVSTPVDFFLDEIAVAEGSLSKRAEFLAKHCNVKQNSSQAWLPAQAVEKCSGAPIDLAQFRDHYCVAGIDLSRAVDLTCCCAVIEKDGVLNVVAKFFLPAEKLDEATARDGLPYRIYIERGLLQLSGENAVNYRDVYAWMVELIEKWRIYPLQTGYDRAMSTYLIQDLQSYGFLCDDVYQGFNLSPVIDEMEALIKDGKVNIGDNDLLKVHLLNCALKSDNDGQRHKLVKISAADHIDGAAALLDALTVRQKWSDQIGAQLRNEG